MSEPVGLEPQSTSRRRTPTTTTTTATSWTVCETTPIELETTACHRGTCRYSEYSTFGLSPSYRNEKVPCWWTLVSHLLVGPTSKQRGYADKHADAPQCALRRNAWTLAVAFLLLGVLLYRLHPSSSSSLPEQNHAPVWKWYHYHYVPKPTTTSTGSNHDPSGVRNLLVAQMAGSGPLNDIADITSRPNRAYSKQWQIDFLRYFGGQGLARECFNKMIVLDALLAQQEKHDPPPKRRYDAVLFLPADSIITDLDFDLLSLLPQDKLVAIAGADGGDSGNMLKTSESGIFMWNLNHEHARTVSKLWLEFVQHPQFTCKDATDMGFLLTALESVDDSRDIRQLVQRLEETPTGFVAPRVIKFVQSTSAEEPRMNSLVRNIYETTATLETVSDSVCYRYYPRCEVLY